MTKENWKLHLEATEGITRPSHGGTKELWQAAIDRHKAAKCPQCMSRIKTMRKNYWSRSRDSIARDMGLTKVIGDCSGSVYYE